MSELDQEEKKLKVSVNMNKEDKEPEQIIVRSDDIICPKCKEPCRIAFDNLMIKLYECSNKHEINDIKIENFYDTQKIVISQIVCENCKLKNNMIVIVHGIGSGIVKDSVHETLSRRKDILDFHIVSSNIGCTLVKIKDYFVNIRQQYFIIFQKKYVKIHF